MVPGVEAGIIIGARRQSIGARHRGKKKLTMVPGVEAGIIIGARRQSIGARHRGKKKLMIIGAKIREISLVTLDAKTGFKKNIRVFFSRLVHH